MNLDERARRAAVSARAAVEAAELRTAVPGGPRPRRAAGRLAAAGVVVLAVAVVGAAVANTGGDGPVAEGPPGATGGSGDEPAFDPQLVSSLQAFDGCDELVEEVRERALEDVTAYGLEGEYARLFSGRATGELEDAAPTAARDASVPDVSSTNVQEAGVDEPDLVETDGELVVAVARGALQVVDVSGPEPRQRGRLRLAGGGQHGLLLDGDRLLVVSGDLPSIDDVSTRFDVEPLPQLPSRTTLRLVDLADPDEPTVVATMELDGTLVDSRRVGGSAQVVVRSSPTDLRFTSPSDGTQLAQQLALESNRDVVRSASAEDLLLDYRLDGEGETRTGLAVDCADVGRPPGRPSLTSLSVLAFDLAGSLEPLDSVGALADGATVYASTDRLFVAADADQTQSGTAVHGFDTSDPGDLRYTGSGEVGGSLLDSYSMSEHEGVLRVVTTSNRFGNGISAVTTLTQGDGALVTAGRLDGLGRGEALKAVRFLGDTAYVVTFRVTDPLFVVDLSDPGAPRLSGELQVPGYSGYLLPLDGGRLLGVGQDGTADGRAVGTQVSLFDVSDPAAPTRVDALTLPGGNSEAETEPKALLSVPERGLVALPLLQYEAFGADGRSGAVVLDVDGTTVRERGRVSHGDADDSASLVRRAVLVGDVLYTLSARGLAADDVVTLERRGYVTF